jgi:hypothetical protein
MNRRQKILTIAVLFVFSAIITLHYIGFVDQRGNFYPYVSEVWRYASAGQPTRYFHDLEPVIKNVQMPLLVLAVFYAGLFFILATPRGPES